MVSPLNQTNQGNLHAPLSEWLIARSFDSASECEATIMAMQKALWTTKDQVNWKVNQAKIERGEQIPLSYSEYAKRTTNAQCVASDDPRCSQCGRLESPLDLHYIVAPAEQKSVGEVCSRCKLADAGVSQDSRPFQSRSFDSGDVVRSPAPR
jgi:hypothetical protein